MYKVPVIKRGLITVIILGIVLGASWTYAPTPVNADDAGLGSLPQEILSIPSLISTSIFATADVIYGARGKWLPPGWAITQIALGATLNSAAANIHFEMQDRLHKHDDGILVLSVFHIAFAAWFFTHSVLSLILYEPSGVKAASREIPPDDEVEDKQTPAKSVDWGITPIEGGAMGVLVGRL